MLGFEEIAVDYDERWAQLERGEMEIALAEGEPSDGGGRARRRRGREGRGRAAARGRGVEVGIVLELHGAMRLLDVFDPDGNRIQLAEELP